MDRSFSGVSARIFLFHGTMEDVSTLKNIYQYKYEYLFNSKKIQDKKIMFLQIMQQNKCSQMV